MKSLKVFGTKILNRLGVIKKCIPKQSVLILMYHRVNKTQDCLGLTVSPDLFSLQLQYLKDNYRIVSVKDAVKMISKKSVDTRCCAVTFDDGYRDNIEIAAPLLAKHGVPATIFVTYDAIETGQFGWGAFDRTILNFRDQKLDLSAWGVGEYQLTTKTHREQAVVELHRLLKQEPDSVKKDVVGHVVSTYGDAGSPERVMMDWDEVRLLAQDGLFTIGAHTVTHPILSRISREQAVHEIINGKQLLECKIGKYVDFFAYPNGGKKDINNDIISIVKKAGYKAAFTTIYGLNAPGDESHFLKRIDVTTNMSTNNKENFSPDMFKFYISGIVSKFRNKKGIL